MNNIETQREGYLQLIDLCVGASRKNELTHFINNLKTPTADNDFMTTFNFVINYLDQNEIHFIMGLDWKQDIEDLVWRINSSLLNNFNQIIEWPNAEKYGDRASISFQNVFKDFDDAIKTQSFRIGFIDTDGDEYVIIIHQIKDEKTVKEAINKIGFNYLNIDSPELAFLSTSRT